MEVIPTDTVDRIFELLSLRHMEQKELANWLGILPQTVTDWKNRKSKSYTKYIPKLALALNTTSEWLLTGNGSKDGGPIQSEGTGTWEPLSLTGRALNTEEFLKAAFFEGGQDLTQEEMDELWEDANDYIQYKLDQRRRKKK